MRENAQLLRCNTVSTFLVPFTIS